MQFYLYLQPFLLPRLHFRKRKLLKLEPTPKPFSKTVQSLSSVTTIFNSPGENKPNAVGLAHIRTRSRDYRYEETRSSGKR